MKKNDNNENQKLFELTNKIKNNINERVRASFDELTKNQKHIGIKELEKLKNNVVNNINNEFKKVFEYLLIKKEPEKIIQNNKKNECNLEITNQLNFFTSKDIQVENKGITRNFQNEAYNYMNSTEKIENENVANFLKNVAEISRYAYNERNKLYKYMKDKYDNNKGIHNYTKEEDDQKEFSSWVKNFEKKNGKKEYENIINKIEIIKKYENSKEKIYFQNLLIELTIMYFHCSLAFPIVEINFQKEENFISDKMIDFINRGRNRKVNFIVLPSLISLGSYLENGKSWVFTFVRKTFKFEEMVNDNLSKILRKDISEKSMTE